MMENVGQSDTVFKVEKKIAQQIILVHQTVFSQQNMRNWKKDFDVFKKKKFDISLEYEIVSKEKGVPFFGPRFVSKYSLVRTYDPYHTVTFGIRGAQRFV